MTFIKSFLSDIRKRKNLEYYLVLLAIIVVFAADILGIDTETALFEIVLAALAVILYGFIDNKRQNEQIEDTLSQIKNSTGISEKFFSQVYDFDEMKEAIVVAQNAYFWGFTFIKTIEYLDFAFEKGLRNGLHLRFLVLKPNSDCMKMAALRSVYKNDVADQNAILYSSLSRLSDIKSSPGITGKLEVRSMDYLPPWTLNVIDYHLPTCHMSVQLASLHTHDEDRPSFRLSPMDDTHWFQFFHRQFELAWENADPINLEDYNRTELYKKLETVK